MNTKGIFSAISSTITSYNIQCNEESEERGEGMKGGRGEGRKGGRGRKMKLIYNAVSRH